MFSRFSITLRNIYTRRLPKSYLRFSLLLCSAAPARGSLYSICICFEIRKTFCLIARSCLRMIKLRNKSFCCVENIFSGEKQWLRQLSSLPSPSRKLRVFVHALQLLLLVGLHLAAHLLLLPLDAHQLVAQVLAESHQQHVLVLEMLQHVVRALIRRVAESDLTQTITDRQHLLLVLLRLRLAGRGRRCVRRRLRVARLWWLSVDLEGAGSLWAAGWWAEKRAGEIWARLWSWRIGVQPDCRHIFTGFLFGGRDFV